MPKKLLLLVNTNLKKVLKMFVDIIFPVQCCLCRIDGKYLCTDCEPKLSKGAQSVTLDDKSFAKYNYQDQKVKNIIFKIKYNHHPCLGQEMGKYCVDFIKNNTPASLGKFIFVPIPISKKRLEERGYNQAHHISIGIDKENTFQILRRDKNTLKLKDSDSIEFRKNQIQNSMSVDNFELEIYLQKNNLALNNIKNIKIILVDDITTSGATFYEARRALVEYGFAKENIYSFALAH